MTKFISKGEKVTAETTENAAKWRSDAIDAGHEASHAIAVSKRSLYVRGAAAEDDEFWREEHEKANDAAKKAMKLTREAKRQAEHAAEFHSKFIDVLKRRAASEHEVKEAEDEYTNAQSIANDLKRNADAAASEASEGYATVAYALQVRTSPEDIETFVKRDQFNAEMAMGHERRVKRESFFADKAARKREAIHRKALELREKF